MTSTAAVAWTGKGLLPGLAGGAAGRGFQSGNGALATAAQSYSPAYGTPTCWNCATGLGTINASNLVTNWPNIARTIRRTSASLESESPRSRSASAHRYASLEYSDLRPGGICAAL